MEHARGIRICYGADLAGDRLVAVRCVRTRKGPRCETVFDGDPAGALPVLAADLERRDVLLAACMPAQESFARWLHTPLNSEAKALRVLPSMLDIQLPFPLETCEHRAAHVRRAENRAVDILAVAARREDIRNRLEAFSRSGLDPESLDHEGLALWTQSLRETPLERGAPRIVAYVGNDHSTLAIGHGPETGFTGAHSMRLGIAGLFESRDPDEPCRQFAQRARQVARAQLPGILEHNPIQWLWCGPGAADPAKRARLEEHLRELGPLTFRAHDEPAAFLARALAVRALLRDSFACNLRGGSLAHPKAALRAARLHKRAIASLAAAGLILVAAAVAWHVVLRAGDSRLQTQLTATAQRVANLPRVPKGQEVLVVQRAIEEQAPLDEPFRTAFDAPAAALLADLTREAARLGVRLESLSVRPDSAALRGSASDWNHGDALAGVLRNAGLAADVQREDAGADERVHFSIKAARAGGGKS